MIRVLAYGMSLLFYHRQVCGHARGPKINVLNPDCQGPGRLRRPLQLPTAPPSNSNAQRISALPADRPPVCGITEITLPRHISILRVYFALHLPSICSIIERERSWTG